jgi:hypothetical protein
MADGSILVGVDWAALRKKLRYAPLIKLDLTVQKAMELVATIQLALRHPGYREHDIAAHMALFAVSLETEIVRQAPELAPVLAAGWDPSQDVLHGHDQG